MSVGWANRRPYGAKKRKYGDNRVEYAGHWFDSKLECAVYRLLELEEKAGKISNLRHHPGSIYLSKARIRFEPDFEFVNESEMAREWAEAKGFANDRWPMKKKLWRHYGPGPLRIYRGAHNNFWLAETIIPKVDDES